jgi:hypothetical protein
LGHANLPLLHHQHANWPLLHHQHAAWTREIQACPAPVPQEACRIPEHAIQAVYTENVSKIRPESASYLSGTLAIVIPSFSALSTSSRARLQWNLLGLSPNASPHPNTLLSGQKHFFILEKDSYALLRRSSRVIKSGRTSWKLQKMPTAQFTPTS